MENMQINFFFNIIFALAEEIEKLKAENQAVCQEKADIESMMETASLHADDMGSDLLNRVDAVEHQFTEVIESIPVPITVTRHDGQLLYANKSAYLSFGFSAEDILKQNARDLYKNKADREKFLSILQNNGEVCNFETELKKKDGSFFLVYLSSSQIVFKNEKSLLTVIYDLTERLNSEKEIRELKEKLDRAKEREKKYLIFTIDGEEYGICLTKIKEIVGIMPITPVPDTPDFVKGVANLRGRLVPIADLRPIFGAGAADTTERTCVIISEIQRDTEKSLIGIIVDSVTEIMGIRGKDIEPPPKLDQDIDLSFISGIARVGDNVKILLDIVRLWEKFFRQSVPQVFQADESYPV